MNYGKKSTAKKRTALISRSSMIFLTFLLFVILNIKDYCDKRHYYIMEPGFPQPDIHSHSLSQSGYCSTLYCRQPLPRFLPQHPCYRSGNHSTAQNNHDGDPACIFFSGFFLFFRLSGFLRIIRHALRKFCRLKFYCLVRCFRCGL